MPSFPQYKFLKILSKGNVFEIRMNRPERRNAMNTRMWREIGHAVAVVAEIPACRCILLTGAGKLFSSGIDLMGGNVLLEVQNGTCS